MGSGQGGKHGGRPNFESFDTDGDGQLSREEMSQMKGPRGAPPPEMFDRMDVNGDGYVTLDEMQAMRQQHQGGGQGHGGRQGQGGPTG
jgi:Ca2+-binding EF-hand superfamily protein